MLRHGKTIDLLQADNGAAFRFHLNKGGTVE
jgi:hypothetical protein